MNVVAHVPGVAGAVLLRGAEPLQGFDADARLAGPGLIGRAFHLTKADSGRDLVTSALHLRGGEPVAERDVVRAARVGIARSTTSERLWRFYVRTSKGVSRR